MQSIELIERIRQRCEEDFKFFVRYFFKVMHGKLFRFSWHHHKICDALMDVFYGRTTHLIINIPPRYSKTELCVKMFSAWGFVKNPMSKFLHLSYADSLALDNSNEVRNILVRPEFQQLWPHITIRKDKKAKEGWGTIQSGSFIAAAAGGQVTGKGAGTVDDFRDEHGFGGAIIIDDPLKPDDAHSDVLRESVNRRWDGTIKSRFNSTKTPCIVIMQRIHEDDFCGMLLKDEEYDFKQLSLPAIIDEGLPTERALWPEKHTLLDLYKMRSKNSYMFASQMQQMPSPLGGGLIKGEWFGDYDVLPRLKYRAMFVDTAQKKGTYNDYQVGEIWGLGFDGCLYLIDVLKEKFDAYELEKRMPDFWMKHKDADQSRLRYMAIEDKVSGTALIQKIQRMAIPKIPVREIKRGPDSNKLTRVMDSQGYIESGYVKIPRVAPWRHDFIAECEAFTPNDTHKHDDMIDAMCDAIANMLHNNAVNIKEML